MVQLDVFKMSWWQPTLFQERQPSSDPSSSEQSSEIVSVKRDLDRKEVNANVDCDDDPYGLVLDNAASSGAWISTNRTSNDVNAPRAPDVSSSVEPPRDVEVWHCQTCTFINIARFLQCDSCGALKPHDLDCASIDSDGDVNMDDCQPTDSGASSSTAAPACHDVISISDTDGDEQDDVESNCASDDDSKGGDDEIAPVGLDYDPISDSDNELAQQFSKNYRARFFTVPDDPVETDTMVDEKHFFLFIH